MTKEFNLNLYEQSNGDVLRGYLLLKQNGANVPSSWLERYVEGRKKVEKNVAKILKEQDLSGYGTLEDWNHRYKVENFYRGIRALLEMERQGKTKI